MRTNRQELTADDDFRVASAVPRCAHDPCDVFAKPGISLGVAYSPYFNQLWNKARDLVDYVEVPFELLRHDPQVAASLVSIPIILHCASLSVAGTVCPDGRTVANISEWIEWTRTPWLGEHLSFVLAERSDAFPDAEEYAPGQPYNIGYTAAPPMNRESMRRVLANIAKYSQQFSTQLLLENSPLYFKTPGSTMNQSEFMLELCDNCDVGILFDVTHFLISCCNMKLDPLKEINRYPLDRIVEIHLSGIEIQNGIHWDNHAATVPEEVFALLNILLPAATLRAITLEYNWISRYPQAELIRQLRRVRTMVLDYNE